MARNFTSPPSFGPHGHLNTSGRRRHPGPALSIDTSVSNYSTNSAVPEILFRPAIISTNQIFSSLTQNQQNRRPPASNNPLPRYNPADYGVINPPILPQTTTSSPSPRQSSSQANAYQQLIPSNPFEIGIPRRVRNPHNINRAPSAGRSGRSFFPPPPPFPGSSALNNTLTYDHNFPPQPRNPSNLSAVFHLSGSPTANPRHNQDVADSNLNTGANSRANTGGRDFNHHHSDQDPFTRPPARLGSRQSVISDQSALYSQRLSTIILDLEEIDETAISERSSIESALLPAPLFANRTRVLSGESLLPRSIEMEDNDSSTAERAAHENQQRSSNPSDGEVDSYYRTMSGTTTFNNSSIENITSQRREDYDHVEDHDNDEYEDSDVLIISEAAESEQYDEEILSDAARSIQEDYEHEIEVEGEHAGSFVSGPGCGGNISRQDTLHESDQESVILDLDRSDKSVAELLNELLSLDERARLSCLHEETRSITIVPGTEYNNPFCPAELGRQKWKNLYEMALRSHTIWRELALFVRVELVAHATLYNNAQVIGAGETMYAHKYMASLSVISPFEQLYTSELRIHVAMGPGYLHNSGSARYFSEPDQRALHGAREKYHFSQHARLQELVMLIKWAHKTFHNLQKITFCGNLGQQRIYDDFALRVASDDTYIDPGDCALPPIGSFAVLSDSRPSDAEDVSLPSDSKRAKLRQLMSKVKQRIPSFTPKGKQTATSEEVQEAEQHAPTEHRLSHAVPRQYGAHRHFLAHNAVLEAMRIIKRKDKVSLVAFGRGFFVNHHGAHVRDVQAARAARRDAEDSRFEAIRRGADPSTLPIPSIPLHTIQADKAIASERLLVQEANVKWGHTASNLNGRNRTLRFAVMVDGAFEVE